MTERNGRPGRSESNYGALILYDPILFGHSDHLREAREELGFEGGDPSRL